MEPSLENAKKQWPNCDIHNPAIKALAESHLRITYKKKGEIFRSTDRLEFIYLIETGTAALFVELGNEKISISEIMFRDDLFGFATSGFHDSSAMAMSDLVVMAYPIRQVVTAQKSSIEFSTLLLNHQLFRLKRNQRQIHRVSQLSAIQAVRDYIHELAMNPSGKLTEGQIVRLPLNRFKTANYLGLTFETVSRSFSQLKKMGLIDFSNAHSVVVKQPFEPSIYLD